MLGACIVAFIVLGQDPNSGLDQPLTFVTEGDSVESALRRLSSETGLKLEARGQVKNGTLVLRFDKVVTKDALDRIAKVLSAEWKKESEKRLLVLPRETERRQAADEVKSREQIIEGARKKEAALVHPWSPAEAASTAVSIVAAGEKVGNENVTLEQFRRLMNVSASSPGGRAARKAFALLDPHTLASLAPGHRIVFSSEPNKKQLAFPKDAGAVLNDFNNEQEMFRGRIVESLEKYPLKQWYDPRRNAFGSTKPAKRLIVSCARLTGSDQLLIDAKLCDDSGAFSGIGRLSVTLVGKSPKSLAIEAPGALSLSPDSTSFLSLLRFPYFKKLVSGIDSGAEVERIGSDIVTTEPLCWVQGALLVKAAEKNGRNLVAWIPDRALLSLEQMTPKPQFSVSEVLGLAAEPWSCKVHEEGSFLEVSPVEPGRARQEYVDRSNWFKYFAAVRAKGTTTLEDAAEYSARTSGDLCLSSFDQNVAAVFMPTIGGSFGYQSVAWSATREPLRSIGDLSLMTRESLFKGGEIAFSLLSPNCKSSLTLWLYGALSPALAATHGLSLGAVNEEVTEAWPQGIPAAAKVRLVRTTVPVVFDASHRLKQIVNHDSAFRIEHAAGLDELAQGDPTLAAYQAGFAIDYVLTIESPDGIKVSETFSEPPVAPKAGWVRFDQLPTDVIQAIRESTKKARIGDQGTGRGRNEPPPHYR